MNHKFGKIEWVLVFFILLSFFTAFISVIGTSFDLRVIKLWKELFIVLIFLMSFQKINKYTFFIEVFTYLMYITYILYSFKINDTNIFYQLKLDLPMFLFIAVIKSFSYNGVSEKFKFFFDKYIYSLLFLNVIAMVLEILFIKNFMRMLNVGYGNWGDSSGIRLITTFGFLRAPGIFLSFTGSGAFNLLLFIICNEKNKKWYYKIVALIGIILSTYKTAYLGLMLYLFLKYTLIFIKKRELKIIYINLITWGSFFISFCALTIENLVQSLNIFDKKLVYNSIDLRVLFTKEIIEKFDLIKFFFGAGFGVNGSYGDIKSIPLDSTYLYILSNFGIMGILIFLTAGFWMFNYILLKRKDEYGIIFYLSIFFAVTFFQNLEITNFPLNIYLIILIGITLFKDRFKLKKKEVLK